MTGRDYAFFGASARAPSRMPSAIIPVIAACQCPAAARPNVPAHEIEENASAKVATRDEVWRRRKCWRLAWVRNHSWIKVADAAETPMPATAASASFGEAHAMAITNGANTRATLPVTASILARTIQCDGTG